MGAGLADAANGVPFDGQERSESAGTFKFLGHNCVTGLGGVHGGT